MAKKAMPGAEYKAKVRAVGWGEEEWPRQTHWGRMRAAVPITLL